MTRGVPSKRQSPIGGSSAVHRRTLVRAVGKRFPAGPLILGVLCGLFFASSALGATATVGLGTAESFSVLGGSTVTNTGPTTMFGDLGLSPGSSVTGAPHVLGETHVDDAVAIGAKSSLTTAYNDAASRPSSGSAGTDLSGQVFLPGVRTASSSLLLSSGSVTLDAQGNPGAVFIFQIGSTLITGSNTTVLLTDGAQACNVFWQVGSSATLGTGTRFVGTIMASASITADTAATIHGRLLASTGAVTLDTNTLTTSNCSSGSTETITEAEVAAGIPGTTTAATPVTTTVPGPLSGSKATGKHSSRKPHKKSAKRRPSARPALPHKRGAFTG
jgi:hypothetical protein